MSAEGLLNDPALFEDAVCDDKTEERLRKIALALEYLDLVDAHGNPAGYRSIAFHCRRIAKDALEAFDALDELLDGPDVNAARRVLERCRQYCRGEKNYSEDLCGNQILRRVRAEHRVVLHAIDATPARWRGDAGSSPLDGASTAASSPRNALVRCTRRTG